MTSRETERTITRREALRLFMGSAAAAGAAAAVKPAAAIAATAQQKADDAQAQADKSEQDLANAQSSYEAAQAQLDQIAAEYSEAAARLSQTQGQIAQLNVQIQETEEQIATLQSQIAASERQMRAKQKQLGNRMSAAYKSGNQSAIDLLLSSSSFEELTSNVYYLDKLTSKDKALIEEVKVLKAGLEQQEADLEQQKAALEGQKSDLETLQVQQQEELADAQAKQDAATTLVNSLADDVAALVAQHNADLAAAQEAAEEAKRVAAAAKAANKSWATSTNTSVLGNGSLSAVTSAAASTPSPGNGLCAAWVTNVFAAAGVGSYSGNACDMCAWWCGNDVSALRPGMIIAVESSSSGTAAGRIYGHIGIYLGDGLVHHNIGYIATDTVGAWVSKYCQYMSARCGWLGGIALS